MKLYDNGEKFTPNCIQPILNVGPSTKNLNS